MDLSELDVCSLVSPSSGKVGVEHCSPNSSGSLHVPLKGQAQRSSPPVTELEAQTSHSSDNGGDTALLKGT